MKNNLALLALSFFTSTQLFSADQTTSQKKDKSNPFKTAWEHKKKIVAGTVIVIATSLIYFHYCKTQAKWNRLKNTFDLLSYSALYAKDKKIRALEDLVSFTQENSWFISPTQKKYVSVELNSAPQRRLKL
jgi:hypothetical protein